jgi:hypothetical protein
MTRYDLAELRLLDSATGAPVAAQGTEESYRFGVVTVAEAVEHAITGRWQLPEFQRQFVWRPAQACALADSLWRNYPIGPLLLWQVSKSDSGQPSLWIADGQQRLTTLCLLSGAVPLWLKRTPGQADERIRRRFDIRFDVSARTAPRFIAPGRRGSGRDPRLVPVRRLMAIGADSRGGANELERMVRELRAAHCCPELDDTEIYRRLSRVATICRREILATFVTHRQRDEVLDIFARLNSRGMRFRRLLLKLAMEEIPAALRGMKGRGQL